MIYEEEFEALARVIVEPELVNASLRYILRVKVLTYGSLEHIPEHVHHDVLRVLHDIFEVAPADANLGNTEDYIWRLYWARFKYLAEALELPEDKPLECLRSERECVLMAELDSLYGANWRDETVADLLRTK